MRSQLVVFFAVLGVAMAAVSLATLEPKPEKFKNVEGCYIKDLDAVIPFGQSRPAKTSCMEYRCGSEYVSYVSCGAVLVKPPLELEERKDLPYPGCCPRPKSPTNKV